MPNNNKVGINDSNIQAGINGNSFTLINEAAVKEIGNQLARLGIYIQDRVKNTIIKFTNKIQNFNQEKFSQTLEKSDIFLRTLDDSKFAGTEEMQEIRARILAQEYSHPNSISMRSWEEMKKMSAAEFKYFEENIAPYATLKLPNTRYCKKSKGGVVFNFNSQSFTNSLFVDNMKVVSGVLNFDDFIDEQRSNNQDLVFCMKNGYKLQFFSNAIQVIENKKSNTIIDMDLLTEFGVDLCKICEPRPWDLMVINETKIELEKLGLKYNEDFKFLDENNQNILQ